MKKKLLFVLPSLKSGGAEKSLVTLLQTIDPTRYDVDLMLFRREGLFLTLVPEWVHVMDAGEDYRMFDGSLKNAVLYFIKRGKFLKALYRLFYALAKGDPTKSWKYLSKVLPRLRTEYDGAFGYLEGTSTYYVVDHTKAKKKISFLHTDYSQIQDQLSLDTKYYGKLDTLVGVSEKCTEKAEHFFPFLAGKTVTMYNILSAKIVHKMAEDSVDLPRNEDEKVLLTVGRLSPPKGIDQAVDACAILKQRGRKFRWYHIGIGELQQEIEQQIANLGLKESFILLGERSNPYPYVKQADIYVQPSRFEGKSIAIDEAKCLAKPIVVTDFGTVHDQIESGKNGLIVPMSPEGIAQGVESLLDAPELCRKLSENLQAEKIGNEEEVEKLYAMV